VRLGQLRLGLGQDLAIGVGMVAATGLVMGMMASTLPDHLNLLFGAKTVVGGTYSVMSAATLLTVLNLDRLGRMWGRDRLIVLAFCAMALAPLLLQAATSLPLVLVAVTLWGAAATTVVQAQGLVLDAARGRGGLLVGLLMAVTALCRTSIGLAVGGALADAYGHRTVFALCTGCAVVAALGFGMVGRRRRNPERPDEPGDIDRGSSRLTAMPAFIACGLIGLIGGISASVMGPFLILYGREVVGGSLTRVSLVLGTTALFIPVFHLLAGHLGDRASYRSMVLLGNGAAAAAMLGISIARTELVLAAMLLLFNTIAVLGGPNLVNLAVQTLPFFDRRRVVYAINGMVHGGFVLANLANGWLWEYLGPSSLYLCSGLVGIGAVTVMAILIPARASSASHRCPNNLVSTANLIKRVLAPPRWLVLMLRIRGSGMSHFLGGTIQPAI